VIDQELMKVKAEFEASSGFRQVQEEEASAKAG
jgi:hypothetical protein